MTCNTFYRVLVPQGMLSDTLKAYMPECMDIPELYDVLEVGVWLN